MGIARLAKREGTLDRNLNAVQYRLLDFCQLMDMETEKNKWENIESMYRLLLSVINPNAAKLFEDKEEPEDELVSMTKDSFEECLSSIGNLRDLVGDSNKLNDGDWL